MKTPRLAPGGVGRGRFVLCLAFCGPLCGVLVAGSEKHCQTIKSLYGLVNGLYNGLPFSSRSAILDTGAKMPPAGLWMAYKRRIMGGKIGT